jgi:flagellar biosynthesis protein FliR
MNDPTLDLASQFLERLDLIWTFLLLAIRWAGMMLVLPGIGGGERGMQIRVAAILVLSYASLVTSPMAALPADFFIMLAMASSEFLLGFGLGVIPAIIISGLQTAGHLTSTKMGLGAAQLVDPTLGINVTSVSRLLGDLGVLLFLFIGGHHVIIYAVSGMGGVLVPGTFVVGANSLDVFISQTAHIFRIGVMVSAPVVVALLLTQFVMGLITKAVPTVNIFIVSFPLTIGIGLILTVISLPDIYIYMQRQLVGIENLVLAVTSDVVTRSGP